MMMLTYFPPSAGWNVEVLERILIDQSSGPPSAASGPSRNLRRSGRTISEGFWLRGLPDKGKIRRRTKLRQAVRSSGSISLGNRMTSLVHLT